MGVESIYDCTVRKGEAKYGVAATNRLEPSNWWCLRSDIERQRMERFW